ncbi:MAG: alpha/beta fold hydrolase [Pseudonocardiaceae bacterium]|nr:alpha/beta fold hydrolase [Pseudonocardiaceae bacterium]
MQLLRTPEGRFAGLADFPYEPQYAEVADPDGGTLRMSWVQAGPRDGEPVVLLHGEPTWPYLYRSMIPLLAEAGLRVVAPDLVGFGRSDKPAAIADHSYARHVAWLGELLLDRLSLRGATLLGQDWGGLLGLRIVAEHPDRFDRVVAANTGMPTGDHDMPQVWWRFRRMVDSAPQLDIGRTVASGCVRGLPDSARAGYDAPFPDESFMAGPRAMPRLVPTAPTDPATEANRAAWERLGRWDKPFLVAFSDSDPITGPMAPIFGELVPGTRDREHPVIAGAGHFLQEDAGEELTGHVLAFIRS